MRTAKGYRDVKGKASSVFSVQQLSSSSLCLSRIQMDSLAYHVCGGSFSFRKQQPFSCVNCRDDEGRGHPPVVDKALCHLSTLLHLICSPTITVHQTKGSQVQQVMQVSEVLREKTEMHQPLDHRNLIQEHPQTTQNFKYENILSNEHSHFRQCACVCVCMHVLPTHFHVNLYFTWTKMYQAKIVLYLIFYLCRVFFLVRIT